MRSPHVPTGPQPPVVDACGCTRFADGTAEVCWNHGRYRPGHPAYLVGLREAQEWLIPETKEAGDA